MVLAGGTSKRFGTNKLTHPLGKRTLLESALEGLPRDARVVIVGPAVLTAADPTDRAASAIWVRETPPGGGPAAAMVTGLREALAEPVDAVVVLPGDAPRAGVGAGLLLARLLAESVDAVVAVDPDGRPQPLQLALRPAAARALIEAGGARGGAGASARALVETLVPPALPHPLAAAEAFDIDTNDQLMAWGTRDSTAIGTVLAAVDSLPRVGTGRPPVVAVDGPPGSAPSALAVALQLRSDGVVLGLDDIDAAAPRDGSSRLDALIEDAVRRRATAPLVILDGLGRARPDLVALADVVVLLSHDPAGSLPGGFGVVVHTQG